MRCCAEIQKKEEGDYGALDEFCSLCRLNRAIRLRECVARYVLCNAFLLTVLLSQDTICVSMMFVHSINFYDFSKTIIFVAMR